MSEVINKAHLIFQKDGLTLKASDNVMVTYINMKLEESFFSEYSVDDTIEIGVDLSKLLKIFRCSTKMDTFSLQSQKNNQELKI